MRLTLEVLWVVEHPLVYPRGLHTRYNTAQGTDDVQVLIAASSV